MVKKSNRWRRRLGFAMATLVLTGCGQGREARLQEVLDRSRASPEHVVKLESSFLEDSDPDVRALAVWAIGDSKSPGGAEALAPMAKDRDPSVRLAAARALCRLVESSGAATDRSSDSETKSAAAAQKGPSPQGADPSGESTSNGNSSQGADGSGEHASRDADASAVRSARETDASAESSSQEVHGTGGEDQAQVADRPSPGLEALVALAADSDTQTRRAVIRCFAESAAPPVGVLPIALIDPDKDVRVMALAALTRRPEKGSLPHLQTAFESKDPEEQIAAIAAIRALGDPEALPVLESAAAARLTPSVRESVESAILELRATAEARAREPQDRPPATEK